MVRRSVKVTMAAAVASGAAAAGFAGAATRGAAPAGPRGWAPTAPTASPHAHTAPPPARAASPRARAHTVSAQLVASGLGVTTAFAFGAGQTFIAESSTAHAAGGVYVLRQGHPVRLPSPDGAFGLAWQSGALYVSGQSSLVRMSRWNGTRFDSVRTIYRAPRGFPGFGGLGFGADGRLLAGVRVANSNDHAFTSAPYAYDVLSFPSGGGTARVFARGIREAWQLAFPRGSSSPFTGDLGQDQPTGIRAPDLLLRIRRGQDYGFPRCNWVDPRACGGYARPFKILAPHTDPLGLAIAGDWLYMAEYGADPPRLPARIERLSLKTGRRETVVVGFHAPLVGLGANREWLFVGDEAGHVFRARVPAG